MSFLVEDYLNPWDKIDSDIAFRVKPPLVEDDHLHSWFGSDVVLPTNPFENWVFDKTEMEAVQEDILEDEHYLETFLHHLDKPDRSSVPSYLLKVDKHPDNSSLLQQLDKAHVPWFKLPEYDVDALVQRQVALLLSDPFRYNRPWQTIREESQDAQDNTIYTSTIEAAVAFVYLLYNKVSLFKMGHKHALHPQLNELWEHLVVLGKKGGSVIEAGKLIAELVIDKPKYSFVTEEDVADMLYSYCRQLKYMQLKQSDYNSTYIHTLQVEFPENPEKDQIFEDIHTVIKEMKSTPTILEDDHYTLVLMNLLTGGPVRRDQAEWLVDEALKILDKNKLTEEQILRLHVYLLGLVVDWETNMKHQLASVWQPLNQVYNSKSHSFSCEVIEIVQVAELRRMALGSRFIGRSHFIWAFYECGYGLPSVLREGIKFRSADEDHPPYHIYVAGMKLAESVGAKIMGLECFIFAVLFSDDIHFDEEKMNEMQKDFNNFLEVM